MATKRIDAAEADKIISQIRDLADPNQMPETCSGCGKKTTAPSYTDYGRIYCPTCVVEDMRRTGEWR